ncbi:MAG: hypothetical protein A3E88_04735 [Legionellales bacterium RIFCSPHIGHO2_12_FULL_35_11]|nr:MAG: hypothetical protein A3E88_04735 [Legionellales bacterium RIFCSPHIGHO2_12_FULL_35_11]
MNITKKSFYPTIFIILSAFIIRLFTIGNTNLLVEEAYYWNYANHLDFSYLDHPPVVAYLIKLSTALFGNNEFAIRLPGLICWMITAIYSFKLSELIKPKSGIFTIFLLSFLPFFFIQSIIMTPDLPLLATWSSCLYYLYLVLVRDKNSYWYLAGITFGIGMLSKYSIVLLVPSSLIFLLYTKQISKKLLTKEPYLATLLAIIIFSPVIYWNATHNWVSFIFQSTRRFSEASEFTFHQLIGLLTLFLTPLGLISLYQLFKKQQIIKNQIDQKTKSFFQIFTLTPLLFFAAFSLSHEVKFNWIGPGLLAIIPWIAIQITTTDKKLNHWIGTAVILLLFSLSLIICIATGKPRPVYQAIFTKFIDWNKFEKKVTSIANNLTKEYNKSLVVIPLDKYNIASELAFYQTKDNNLESYHQIVGRNVLGLESLMYKYWYNGEDLQDKILLLISEERYIFDILAVKNNTVPITKVSKFNAMAPKSNTKAKNYYYQAVKINVTRP